mgnify:CR=1 FL=1
MIECLVILKSIVHHIPQAKEITITKTTYMHTKITV